MRDAADFTPRQKILALYTLIIALVLEIVDMTIVNTALPAIKHSLGADSGASQWIIAGYSLAFALLLMAGGRLGDSFGYRRMFILGVAGFTLASAGCGLATNGTQLVTARLLQGATGAVMAPQAMALVQVLFSPLERVARMAMFGIIGGLAAIAGPIIGGMLIEANLFGLGWRLLFLINLPVGLGAVMAGFRLLPEARSGRPAGFDLGGILWFAFAMGALLWPLIGAGEAGRGPEHFITLIGVPVLGFMGWRHVAQRVKAGRSALFDPDIFAIITFRKGLALSTVFSAVGSGFLLVFAFALQTERGMSALFTGLMHMPYGFGTMLGIGVMSRSFLPRYGRWVLVVGTGVMLITGASALYGASQGHWPWALVGLLLVLSGAGMGMTVGCIGPIVVSEVDRDHAGAASAMLKTCQQFGGALGVALVGSLYFAAVGGAISPTLPALIVIEALLVICLLMALRLPGGLFGAKP